MKGIVCTNLYPISPKRTLTSNTVAVRELIDDAIHQGLNVSAIIRFKPLATKNGFFWPKRRRLGKILIYDVPLIGVRQFYSTILTKFVLYLLGFRGRYDFGIAHLCTNFDAMCRVVGGRVKSKILILHGSDLYDKKLKKCAQRASIILPRSIAIANRVDSLFADKIGDVVYSGVDEKIFINLENKDFSLEESGLKIIIACLFIPLKNIMPSLMAVAELKRVGYQVRVELFGDGPLKNEILSLINQLNLSDEVLVHGFRPRSEVIEAMRSAHLFLMPSAPETFGLVYLEAMASGCVVIGHEGWGIDGVIEDGDSGYLVNKATSESIREKLLKYVRCENRRIMHEKAYKIAQTYTRECAARNYVNSIGCTLAN